MSKAELLKERFESKVARTRNKSCAVWIGATQNLKRKQGGRRGCMYDPTTGKVVSAAKVAWRIFYGTPIPKGQRAVGTHEVKVTFVDHKTGEKRTVVGPCICHLELVNSRQALSGEHHPRSILTDEIAQRLQASYVPRRERMSLAKLADLCRRKYKLRISRETIRQIVMGYSNGGPKVPPEVVEELRSLYQPPRRLSEFVPDGMAPAKSTLASAATKRTWPNAMTPDDDLDEKRSA